MARRRKSGSAGASMDSLLDTMTNVVGILVIMLVVTQLGAADAVKRITGLVTAEELEASRQEAAQLAAQLHEKQAERDALTRDEAQVELDTEAERRTQADLEREIAALADKRVDPEQLLRDLEELAKKEMTLTADVTARLTEIDSLKAKLAATPAGPEPEAKVVNLPDPRPAPENAEAVEWLVRGDRLYPLDDVEALQRQAKEAIEKAAKSLELVRDPTNPERARINEAKLKELFEKQFVGDRTFRLGIAVANGAPQLVLEPRESAGVEARRIESGFGRLIAPLRQQRKFLRFRVFADGFDTYIAARNVAAKLDVPAGWIPYAADAEYRVPLETNPPILVAGYEPPPPRPATPPDPNRPPPPPRTDVD
jgi:hypothetical protein